MKNENHQHIFEETFSKEIIIYFNMFCLQKKEFPKRKQMIINDDSNL